MNYEQVFLYYLSRENFDFDQTILFLEKEGYFLKNPQTSSITIYQKSGDSEVSYDKVKQLFNDNEPFSIILWLDSLSYLTISFYSKDEYFVLVFNLHQLDTSKINKFSEVSLIYIFNELRRVGNNILGFGIDKDGHSYDYDFEYFFDGTNNSIDAKYLLDIFIIPKEKMNDIMIDDRFKLLDINSSFICAVKNKFLFTYVETLIKSE
ncbi:MAG: hypothetical protein AAFQ80_25480 [Cyanobacteria bacterium J06621_8]